VVDVDIKSLVHCGLTHHCTPSRAERFL
jgi:hypothetical protein